MIWVALLPLKILTCKTPGIEVDWGLRDLSVTQKACLVVSSHLFHTAQNDTNYLIPSEKIITAVQFESFLSI